MTRNANVHLPGHQLLSFSFSSYSRKTSVSLKPELLSFHRSLNVLPSCELRAKTLFSSVFSLMRLAVVWSAGLTYRADSPECVPPPGDDCPPVLSKGPGFSSSALLRPWRQEHAFITGIVPHSCSPTAASEQSTKLPR